MPRSATQIREDVLRDPAYPVHKIADRLLPYLRVLVDQFHPEKVILFGSYADGNPGKSSDVDLLILKPMKSGAVSEATEIRRAIRPLRRSVGNLPFDIMVREPKDMARRVQGGGHFHRHILEHGLRLV